MNSDEYLSISIKDVFLVIKRYKYVYIFVFIAAMIFAGAYLHVNKIVQKIYPSATGKILMGVRMHPYNGGIENIESLKMLEEKYEAVGIKVKSEDRAFFRFNVFGQRVDEGVAMLNNVFKEMIARHDDQYAAYNLKVEEYWQSETKTVESEERRQRVSSNMFLLYPTQVVVEPVSVYGKNRESKFLQLISFHFLRLSFAFIFMGFLTSTFILVVYEKIKQK
jgi:hypothetical protein